MKKAVQVIIFFAASLLMQAQDMAPDTTLYLEDVNISAFRINRFTKGQTVQVADSLTRQEYPGASLAELINGISSAYVRNYGQGTLSTLSFRGTSANHSVLLWNGIRVSPPNIGQVDLSLVQQNFFNNISVLYGGASPMFGSGYIGGGIHLENTPVFEKYGYEARFSLSAGSFKTITPEGTLTFYKKNFFSRSAFTLLNSHNDFPYKDLNGNQEKLPHAAIFRGGVMQDIAIRLPGNQYFMASGWFQYADREIPPTMTQDTSGAVQTDRSWRTMLTWKNFHCRNDLEAKLAYFNEFTRYDDPRSSVLSLIKSQSVVGSFESTREIGENGSLFGGTQYTFEYADLDYYTKPEDQQSLAFYASYRHEFPALKWQASLNGRQELFTGYQSPLLFSFGMEGVVWRMLSARLNVSRNFRAPTMNERFWQPGGNPALEPEESWNEEIGIKAEQSFHSADFDLGLTVFNSNIQDWILWLPGASYWSVSNAQKVWSRGLEISGNQSLAISQIKLLLGQSYTFTKATNQVKLFDQDASYQKQLIYTPLHRFLVRAGVLFKGFNFTLKGNFTGKIYTTKDNLDWLPSYFILDAVASKSFLMKNEDRINIQINLSNIGNVEYQSVPYRPMPGLCFLVTASYSLNKKTEDRRQKTEIRNQKSEIN